MLRHAGLGAVKRQRPYPICHQADERNAPSALRWGDFKWVKTWKTGKLELFDLAKDLSEAKRSLRENAGENQGAGSDPLGLSHAGEGDDRGDEDGEGRVSSPTVRFSCFRRSHGD